MITGNVSDAVGTTPLIRLDSISKLTGSEIYGKAEFLNPGGSVKDRAAKGILDDAEKNRKINAGATIYEGTAGNTGIGFATLAAQRGYKCHFVVPDNQAVEKYQTLRALGAKLSLVPAVPFSDQNHFYHTAKRLAEQDPNGFWGNQFENTANQEMHYHTTGEEIWQQTNGKVEVFVSATGTGGTIAGVSRKLKEKNPQVRVFLADPYGSGMLDYLRTGRIVSEGASITEGIGIMRLTENFKMAQIDEALRISDVQMISMMYHLASRDGLLVGTSAALNVFAACLAAQKLGPGKTVVTVLCDSALRYQSRVFNAEFLEHKKLQVQPIESLLS